MALAVCFPTIKVSCDSSEVQNFRKGCHLADKYIFTFLEIKQKDTPGYQISTQYFF